jgi:SAM-dependent methyltransferase
VTGCDLSSEAIEIARRRYPNIDFRVAPWDGLPFAANSFDVVLAFELIEHIARPSVFIREAQRLLRPGGFLVLTTPNADCGRQTGWSHWAGFLSSFEHLYFFDRESLDRVLKRNGMSIVDIYSQGDGKVHCSKYNWLKKFLRGVRLFAGAKKLQRVLFGSGSKEWFVSSKFHTLLVVARKS